VTPIDYSACWACLDELGLGAWRDQLADLVQHRLSPDSHGDFRKWQHALNELLDEPENTSRVRDALATLSPWRKGPFDLGKITIDAEWRSNLKWDRLLPGIASLEGRTILDVGCGNGYYAFRMKEHGARAVVGVDPTVLYVMQFLAVQRFLQVPDVFVLPLRLDDLPEDPHSFDTTFSMGVLYHQRSPLEHLRALLGTLRPGGQLVLETIYLPGDESSACTPPDRYARMRNVWLLPTIAELTTWLSRSGFRDIEIANQCRTTTDEQRSTEWMAFDSLAQALDPEDPNRTVEGWPAPRRVIAVANAP
jgi:tRNA (mo5U34)-methyltransferase